MVFVILQKKFALIMITPSMAYPIEFKVQNIIIVLGTIAVLGLTASWIASSRVSKNLLE
jgi:lipoprotein-releasing system permease protein